MCLRIVSERDTPSGSEDSGPRRPRRGGQEKSAMGNQVIRYSERPELWDAITALSEGGVA